MNNLRIIKAFKTALIPLALLATQVMAIVPTPAGEQKQAIAITGVTAHTGNGDVIDDAVLTFNEGKITSISSLQDAPSLKGHEVLDMSGKHVYPGFILPDTSLGLVEVNSVRATSDEKERGTLNPSVRSIVAYNTDSEIIPTYRFNGVLMAQIVARGELVAGVSSIVQLDAWNWEDAAYSIDDGVHLYWPSLTLEKFNYQTRILTIEENKQYDALLKSLVALFQNASVYKPESGLNLKLDALEKVINDGGRLFIHVDGAREIAAAIGFARKQHVRNIVLVGARDAMMVKDLILAENIPVILNRVHALPRVDDDAVDFSFSLPARLHATGVKVGLGSMSRMEPAGARNLPFMAGTAVAYGLSKEDALTMITRTNAEILGIADRTGTLEVGKDATLFVSEGDALDMRSNRLLKAYIQGRDIELDGTQQALYKRFNEKYSQ